MCINKELKKYCYTLPYNEEDEAFLLSIINNKKRIADKHIQTLEVYKNASYFFVLLEVQHPEDNSRSTNKLPELLSLNGNHKINLSSGVSVEIIFKKGPFKNLDSANGKPFKRFVMTLELENDTQLLEEYKEVHKADNIWPQIITNMNTIGVKDMEIHLQGCQAFLIMDTNAAYDMKKDGELWSKLPQEKEWQEYVSKFQKADLHSKAVEKWRPMRHINNSK